MIPATLLLLSTALIAGAVPAQDRPADFDLDVRPFLSRYCTSCHGATDPEADLDLVRVLGGRLDTDALDVVLDVRDVLRAHDMPPIDEVQPEPAERVRLIGWAEQRLGAAAAQQRPDPGRVTMRRLSRFEYANTVRDLLAVDVDVRGFPADDLGYGFDNVGETLTVSTLHLETYAAAAEAAARAAWPDPDPASPPTRRFGASALTSSLEDSVRGDEVVLYSNGQATARADAPRRGRYRVRATAHATQAGDEIARLRLLVDRLEVAEEPVEGSARAPATVEVELELDGGPVELAAAFVNDYWNPRHPDPAQRDRNLVVTGIELEGPLDPRQATPVESWLRPLDRGDGTATARARRLLAPFVERAWRRPVTRAEVTRIAGLCDAAMRAGESFDEGVRWAIQATLVSPHFLFRIEPIAARGAEPEALEGHAIATRLSYFLWSTLPAPELLDAARRGELATPQQLRAAVRRLLADPRAHALARNFAGQWLELRRLPEVTPDPDRFPEWNVELAASAARETELLFEAVLDEALPATALLDATFTFVDRRLAQHYGLARDAVEREVLGADGSDPFVRVELDGRRPGGVLGHASFLALTSNPTRTSPVRRGKWILDNLLDDPPPPPPPGNDSFAAEAAIDSAQTLREQMAEHRRRPACAVCHVRMDALGLALEAFDPIGRARERDAGGAIDTRSTLPDGTALAGAMDLQQVVASDPAFRRALLRKLFVYGVGRGIRRADAIAIEAIALRMAADATLEEMIVAIVTMDAFARRSPA